MKMLLLSCLFISSAMASPRMSEFCKARVFAKIDKSLPKNQYLTKITSSDKPNEYVLELTKDMGSFNLCTKEVSITIKDAEDDLCEIGKVRDEDGYEFDCG